MCRQVEDGSLECEFNPDNPIPASIELSRRTYLRENTHQSRGNYQPSQTKTDEEPLKSGSLVILRAFYMTACFLRFLWDGG